jgi:hypothetical protein
MFRIPYCVDAFAAAHRRVRVQERAASLSRITADLVMWFRLFAYASKLPRYAPLMNNCLRIIVPKLISNGWSLIPNMAGTPPSST